MVDDQQQHGAAQEPAVLGIASAADHSSSQREHASHQALEVVLLSMEPQHENSG